MLFNTVSSWAVAIAIDIVIVPYLFLIPRPRHWVRLHILYTYNESVSYYICVVYRRHGSWYEDRPRRVVRNQSDENCRYENDAVTEITESDSESFYCESVTSNSSPRRCVSRSNSRGRSESSDSEIQCSKVVPLPANAVLPSTSPKKRKPRGVLPIDYWERSPECQEAKFNHMDRLDRLCDSRERLVLYTTLYRRHTALEPNMFPCKCCFVSCVAQCNVSVCRQYSTRSKALHTLV